MLPPGVKYVYMNKNWFSGQIPQAWTVPSGLLELYVSDNNFEGKYCFSCRGQFLCM